MRQSKPLLCRSRASAPAEEAAIRNIMEHAKAARHEELKRRLEDERRVEEYRRREELNRCLEEKEALAAARLAEAEEAHGAATKRRRAEDIAGERTHEEAASAQRRQVEQRRLEIATENTGGLQRHEKEMRATQQQAAEGLPSGLYSGRGLGQL